ncbi:MAG: penicillin-binding protein 1C [Pseudomonadota bacterium]
MTGILLALVVITACLMLAFSPRPPLRGDQPVSTAWYDRDGRLLRLDLAGDDRFRLATRLRELPPALINATLLQEDRFFHSHPGVNPLSLIRAVFETYIRRSRPVGGSTITMQLVRLRDDLETRSIPGKLTQIWRALVLERHYSKAEILQAYLNRVPYGGNIEGIDAAALIYFNREPHELALPQIMTLVVIPQNPAKRSPLQADSSHLNNARQRLFERYAAAYDLSGQTAALMQMPLVVHGRDALPFAAPHFINGIETTGAPRIRTTLDRKQQQILERQMHYFIRRNRRLGLDNAAAMLVHAPDMEIRALVGSGDFFNAGIDGQVDATAALRSPGSTLKSFVYALALEQGLIHPGSLLDDSPTSYAEYRPANFDTRFMGPIPADEALQLSRNVPAIALATKLADPDLYTFLQDAGLALPHDQSHYGLSLVVGGAEVSMRKLVILYAMLANGGRLSQLRATRDTPERPARQMLSPESAYMTLKMLERPFQPDVTPFSTRTQTVPVYWKTGTSSGMRDAWTVGVFGPYVLAVWVGHFDGRRNPALVGSQTAAPLFFDIVHAVSGHETLTDRVQAAIDQLNITRIALCRNAVPSAQQADCAAPAETLFIAGKSPIAPAIPTHSLKIVSPAEGVRYALPQQTADVQQLPLEAKYDRQNHPLFWFAGQQLIGTSDHGQPLFWTPRPGVHVIRVLDTEGNSDVATIRVIASH